MKSLGAARFPFERASAAVTGVGNREAGLLTRGSVAVYLLRAPLVQMAAGVVLLWIAVRLTLVDGSGLAEDGGETSFSGTRGLFGAVQAIIVADVAMSLDNVVAIAAIAQGSIIYIAIGLALSIPMLIWGSNLIRELLDKSGFLVLASGAFLGWVAGGVAVADPLVAAPIAAYAPALTYAIPAACAIFVVLQNLILDPRRASARTSCGMSLATSVPNT